MAVLPSKVEDRRSEKGLSEIGTWRDLRALRQTREIASKVR